VKKTLIYYCCFKILYLLETISIVAAAPPRHLSTKLRSHPRLMVYVFTNDHDIIIFIFSRFIDDFEKNDQLFAAQCIWWLANLIQFTEVLTYFRHYRIFPSEYKESTEEATVRESLSNDSSIHPSRVNTIIQSILEPQDRLDPELQDTSHVLQESTSNKGILRSLAAHTSKCKVSRKLNKKDRKKQILAKLTNTK
jgi:hypothetical protein